VTVGVAPSAVAVSPIHNTVCRSEQSGVLKQRQAFQTMANKLAAAKRSFVRGQALPWPDI